MIFVTVGSRPYPFDRLFKKLDELVETGAVQEDIFAQIGSSTYLPKFYNYRDYIHPNEFNKRINSAGIVISHGASGSIVRALKAKKKVITVARLEKYGEHIDDHQIQLNKAFENENYTLAVFDLEDLSHAIKTIQNDEVRFNEWKNDNSEKIINLIYEFIEEYWWKS